MQTLTDKTPANSYWFSDGLQPITPEGAAAFRPLNPVHRKRGFSPGYFKTQNKSRNLWGRGSLGFLKSLEANFADLPGTLHLSRYCVPVADNKAEVEAVRHIFQHLQTTGIR